MGKNDSVPEGYDVTWIVMETLCGTYLLDKKKSDSEVTNIMLYELPGLKCIGYLKGEQF